jgi:hypothetical protein
MSSNTSKITSLCVDLMVGFPIFWRAIDLYQYVLAVGRQSAFHLLFLLAFMCKKLVPSEIITPMLTHRAPPTPIDIAPTNTLSETSRYTLFSDVYHWLQGLLPRDFLENPSWWQASLTRQIPFRARSGASHQTMTRLHCVAHYWGIGLLSKR